MRVLSVVKPYLTKFDASCVVHTDRQRSTINASSAAVALFCWMTTLTKSWVFNTLQLSHNSLQTMISVVTIIASEEKAPHPPA